MPRRKFIDKRNAATFQLVHRAQNDPLIHDENVPSMVFAEVDKQQHLRRPSDNDYAYSSAGGSVYSGSSYRSKKTKQRGDLEDEFGLNVRANEGEAAQHGIFFDDSDYDYMQHMRDLGSGEGPVTWVEAKPDSSEFKGKGKAKMRLEDALRGLDLAANDDDGKSIGQSSMASSAARSLLPEEVLPSEFVQKRTYQDQQDVPDEIAGFQPNMDPRLREVLAALENEEYVDDEEDIFAELTGDGYEIERSDWERLGEQQLFDDGNGDDEGWESDDTLKAPASPSAPPLLLQPHQGEEAMPPADPQAIPTADPTGGAWLDEFKKFKSADRALNVSHADLVRAAPSTLESSAISSLASGRRRKRKGAKTSTTNYSMTSSSLTRTNQLTTLDDRFDKMEAAYSLAEFPEEEDEYLADTASAASGMTGMSKSSRVSKYSHVSGLSGISGISSYSRATDSEAPKLVRSDAEAIYDEFLANNSKVGKKGKVKRFGPQTGMEQLDEIRYGSGGRAMVPERYLHRIAARTTS